jgi:hypothetical protein
MFSLNVLKASNEGTITSYWFTKINYLPNTNNVNNSYKYIKIPKIFKRKATDLEIFMNKVRQIHEQFMNSFKDNIGIYLISLFVLES